MVPNGGHRARGARRRRVKASLIPPRGIEAFRLQVGGEELVVFATPLPAERGPRTLTLAEREVVRLVAEGLSNQAVARRRGTTPRTVANQLASAYRKLGVGSRAALAAALYGQS
jgi:DNA-binding CsgD family transcriptional regulator